MVRLESVLHVYITYALLGSTLAYFLAVVLTGLLRVKEPVFRIRLMWFCLVVPQAGYLLFHVLLPGLGLRTASVPGQASLQGVVGAACLLGYWGSRLILPLLALFLGLVVARVFLQSLAVRLLASRYGLVPAERYPVLADVLSILCPRAGMPIPRVLVISHPRWVCYTYGAWRPVLVISAGALALLGRDELEAVAAHELAHIRRHDVLAGGIASLLRDMMFFLPVAHWAYTGLLREREKATDDLAVEFTGKPVTYAAVLLKAWRFNRSGLSHGVPGRLLPGSCPQYLRGADCISLRAARILASPGKPRSRLSSRVMPPAIMLTVMTVLSLAC